MLNSFLTPNRGKRQRNINLNFSICYLTKNISILLPQNMIFLVTLLSTTKWEFSSSFSQKSNIWITGCKQRLNICTHLQLPLYSSQASLVQCLFLNRPSHSGIYRKPYVMLFSEATCHSPHSREIYNTCKLGWNKRQLHRRKNIALCLHNKLEPVENYFQEKFSSLFSFSLFLSEKVIPQILGPTTTRTFHGRR